jgi:23S rRNA pseudouridine1911/1915/1917 synthase
MEKIFLKFTIPQSLAGQRLDQAVAQLAGDFSRSQLKSWIIEKKLLLDNQPAKPKDKVIEGQHIAIDATIDDNQEWEAQKLPLNIVYEDEHLIVINKPSGLVVHPGAGNSSGTLVNGLLYHAPEIRSLPRCGIVHRIDKDTTGLLVAVKTIKANRSIIKQLQTHEMGREYEAIAKGVLISGGMIDEPIDRHPQNRIKMAIRPNGKPAITHYRIIERYRAHTHVKINLETGRTHQIRVHFNHIMHPLLGDPVYGTHKYIGNKSSTACQKALASFRRQALHAKSLKLCHPATKEWMQWHVDTPEDMQAVLDALTDDAKQFDDYT